jgi:hypothetical protein
MYSAHELREFIEKQSMYLNFRCNVEVTENDNFATASSVRITNSNHLSDNIEHCEDGMKPKTTSLPSKTENESRAGVHSTTLSSAQSEIKCKPHNGKALDISSNRLKHAQITSRVEESIKLRNRAATTSALSPKHENTTDVLFEIEVKNKAGEIPASIVNENVEASNVPPSREAKKIEECEPKEKERISHNGKLDDTSFLIEIKPKTKFETSNFIMDVTFEDSTNSKGKFSLKDFFTKQLDTGARRSLVNHLTFSRMEMFSLYVN